MGASQQHTGGAGFLFPHPYVYIPRFPRQAAAISQWWLAGGLISSANVLGAYQAKGQTLANSYINLNSPGTRDISVVGTAPTIDSYGWVFTGVGNLNSNCIPTTAYSCFVRATSSNASHNALGYIHSGARRNWIIPYSADADHASFGCGNTFGDVASTGVANDHVLGLARNGAGKSYIDGVDTGVSYAAWSGTVTQGCRIGGSYNELSGANSYHTLNVVAAAFFNIQLTGTQAAALSSAMAAI